MLFVFLWPLVGNVSQYSTIYNISKLIYFAMCHTVTANKVTVLALCMQRTGLDTNEY
jgi:hypothetical protein